MNKLSIAAGVIAATLLASCNFKKMSPEDAMDYQANLIINTTHQLFKGQPSIPDGDLTTLIIKSGISHYRTPDLFNENSRENIRARDAMGRLKVDDELNILQNEFGGVIRVVAKDEKIKVIYTNVPDSVNCSLIKNVICEAKLNQSSRNQ